MGTTAPEPPPHPATNPPVPAEEVDEYLRNCLWELRRLNHEQRRLKELYEQTRNVTVGLLSHVGRVMVVDPVDGETLVAYPRRDEVLEVDYDELVEHVGVALANTVCKPPKVDNDRFEEAVTRGLIPVAVAAKVARYKPKAPFVGFNKPESLLPDGP